MDRQILNFTANEQMLTVDNPIRISTNKVNYIEAHFALGDNWSGYDSVRAVWFNDYQTISTVLDSQGVCRVPFEVMKRKGQVKVDLVGSISEGDVLTDRLTSYPVVAVIVDCVAPITGAETSPITPSQFEQFAANVRADADRAEAGAEAAETSADEANASATASAQSATASANSASQAQTYAQNAQNYAVSAETAKDDAIDAKEDAESAKADAESARDQILGMRATANTLAEGSDATASYSNGLLTLGIPRGNTGAKGDKGDKGDTGATPNLSIGTVETLPPTGSSEVTITGTAENPVLNFKLVKGDTGEVTMAQLAQLLPTDTASGAIASWTDGTDVFPAVSVLTTIEPIQSGSGTPSPTNIRPISGRTECDTHRTGVNVWDEEWELGNIASATGATTADSNRIRCKNYIPVVGGQSYYFFCGAGNRLGLFAYDSDKAFLGVYYRGNFVIGGTSSSDLGSHAVTLPTNCKYIKIKCTASYGATYNHDISINYPSTDTDYHAYNGNTYTTPLGRTVYGGTLDVVSGELVVDRAMVTLDGSDHAFFNEVSQGTTADGNLYIAYIANSRSGIKPDSVALSNSYEWVDANTTSLHRGQFNTVGSYTRFVIADQTLDTLAKWDAWLASNPMQLCYELATPQIYQLTPTEVDLLLGQNNLWTDCGSVNVTYKADTYLWVEKKLS